MGAGSTQKTSANSFLWVLVLIIILQRLLTGSKRFMGKGRLEAFSDGVIAIIITIMVLEMKVPHGSSFRFFKTDITRFSQLYIELYKYCHLLEQSPSYDAQR